MRRKPVAAVRAPAHRSGPSPCGSRRRSPIFPPGFDPRRGAVSARGIEIPSPPLKLASVRTETPTTLHALGSDFLCRPPAVDVAPEVRTLVACRVMSSQSIPLSVPDSQTTITTTKHDRSVASRLPREVYDHRFLKEYRQIEAASSGVWPVRPRLLITGVQASLFASAWSTNVHLSSTETMGTSSI